MIEQPEREELVISGHPKSYLEKVFTDFRPVAEVVFVKERNKARKDNLEIDLASFITVKGISAMGNQLTKEKVLEINALEALPYEDPSPEEEATQQKGGDAQKDSTIAMNSSAQVNVVPEKDLSQIEVEEEEVNESGDNTAKELGDKPQKKDDAKDDSQGQTSLF